MIIQQGTLLHNDALANYFSVNFIENIT